MVLKVRFIEAHRVPRGSLHDDRSAAGAAEVGAPSHTRALVKLLLIRDRPALRLDLGHLHALDLVLGALTVHGRIIAYKGRSLLLVRLLFRAHDKP